MPVVKEPGFVLLFVDLSDDTLVTHGPTTNTVTLRPPKGWIYEVIDLGYEALDPIGSGAGTHQIYGTYADSFSDVFRVVSNTGTDIYISVSGFFGTTDSPAAIANQLEIMHKGVIKASYDVPFEFRYTNSTDVDKTGTRTCKLIVKKYPEAKI